MGKATVGQFMDDGRSEEILRLILGDSSRRVEFPVASGDVLGDKTVERLLLTPLRTTWHPVHLP